jgi:hypothetical protein
MDLPSTYSDLPKNEERSAGGSLFNPHKQTRQGPNACWLREFFALGEPTRHRAATSFRCKTGTFGKPYQHEPD